MQHVQNAIDDIMDNFNFEKVHNAMILMDWKWGYIDEAEVPELSELKKTARTLLKHVTADCKVCSTGGFEARNDNNVISLRFMIADWDYDLEE